MRIGICDDYKDDAQLLYSLLNEYAHLHNIAFKIDTYLSETALLKRLDDYDLLLLDVILKDINGIQLAEKIRKTHKDIAIIFVSSSSEYALDAFDVKAFSYILKPINKKDLFHKIDFLLRELHIHQILIEDENHRKRSINIYSITHIEVEQKKTLIHLRNGNEILVSQTLTWWKENLKSDLFQQCYKGIVVNIKFIHKINQAKIILENKQEVYLSRIYRNNIINCWYQYIDGLL